jgi:hypothetical protein
LAQIKNPTAIRDESPGAGRLRRDEAEQGTADLIARRGKSRMIERVVELCRKSQVQNFC